MPFFPTRLGPARCQSAASKVHHMKTNHLCELPMVPSLRRYSSGMLIDKTWLEPLEIMTV